MARQFMVSVHGNSRALGKIEIGLIAVVASVSLSAGGHPSAVALGASAEQSPASTQPVVLRTESKNRQDGDKYEVSRFILECLYAPKGAPPPSELEQLLVNLGESDGAYVPAREGIPSVQVPLGRSYEPAKWFRASAITGIERALSDYLSRNQDVIYRVGVHPQEISRDVSGRLAKDQRKDNRTLTLQISAERRYSVSRFKLKYKFDHAENAKNHTRLPSEAELQGVLGQITVKLGQKFGGFVGPNLGTAAKPITLGELTNEPQFFYSSALLEVEKAVRDYFTDRLNMVGVYVETDPDEIGRGDKGEALDPDPRRKDDTLTLVIWTSKVGYVQTKGSLEGSPAEQNKTDSKRHQYIRENSPLKEGSLLCQPELDDFVLRLNRHPGRRVDVAVAPSANAGEVMLEYLVSEAKPWFVYAQVSNTGTKQTNEWREQFGFVHNQLTGHDDILSVNYTTASFDGSSQEADVLYEAPLFSDRLRWRVYGSWSDFTASDVGQLNASFQGTEWVAGGELTANVFQRRNFFIDAFAGARYQSVEVTDQQTKNSGEGGFFEPYVGLRLDRFSDTASTIGELRLTYGHGDVSQQDLDRLGRLDAQDNWVVLSGNLAHSFFLEPLLQPREFKAGETSLAHEIYLGARGQYAFEHRLIPQAEETLGGFYSVRGYPESVLAADTAFVLTGEYRFHLARIFRASPDSPLANPRNLPILGDFRPVASRAYSRPDWDLIFRGFVDVGRALYTDEKPPESDSTLVGSGVGVELQIKRNISVRMDYGVVLKELESLNVDRGDSRIHFSLMVLY